MSRDSQSFSRFLSRNPSPTTPPLLSLAWSRADCASIRCTSSGDGGTCGATETVEAVSPAAAAFSGVGAGAGGGGRGGGMATPATGETGDSRGDRWKTMANLGSSTSRMLISWLRRASRGSCKKRIYVIYLLSFFSPVRVHQW